MTVAVEVKFLRRHAGDPGVRSREAASQLAAVVEGQGYARGALFLFIRDSAPEAFRAARVIEDGKVSLVVICAPEEVPGTHG